MNSKQTTLRNYFAPRQVQPALTVDSSDEDELVALDQILKPRSAPVSKTTTGTSTPITRTSSSDKRRRSLSIEDKSYSGKFSLAALVADREERNHDKERIARLNEPVHVAVKVTANDERVQELLKMKTDTKQVVYWSAIDETFMAQEAEKLVYNDRDPLLALCHAKTVQEVIRLDRALSTVKSSLDTATFLNAIGIEGRAVTSPMKVNYLLLQKLRCGLRRTKPDSKDVTALLKQLLSLSIDSTFGGMLIHELQESLSTLVQAEAYDWNSLCSLTDNADLQLQIIRAIPSTGTMFAQTFASICFLDDIDVAPTHMEQLTKCHKQLLQQPFLPLLATTDYRQLLQKVNLLSYTLLVVPDDEVVTSLYRTLQELHGKIVDGKAAFIERSEAKAIIQQLSYRLKYARESHGRSGAFDAFKL